MKKALKILGILIAVILILLITTPFIFKDKIQNKVVQLINEELHVDLSLEDVNISLIKNFPKASVDLKQIVLANRAPFVNDTLVSAQSIEATMSIMELFKGEGESMSIEGFAIKDALLHIILDEEGRGNFDIFKTEDKQDAAEDSAPFQMNIQHYELVNTDFIFENRASNMVFALREINHTGTGNFASSKLDLNTKTDARLQLDMDNTNYMNNIQLALNAVIGIDLESGTYTFKENKATLNELPLAFDGFLQLKEEGQLYDLTFNTPEASLASFLSLIPSNFQGNLSDIQTGGHFKIDGFAKGLLSDNSIPQFRLTIDTKDAFFKYPDLPKKVDQIVLNTNIINNTGNQDDTAVEIKKLNFRIDQDTFSGNAYIDQLFSNQHIKADLKGTINLANLSQAYPIKLDSPLKGILKADISTDLDLESLEKERYENIKNVGTLDLYGFEFNDSSGLFLAIDDAAITFNPSSLKLDKFNAKTGKSDINATGRIDNFYGFLFKDQNLKGLFNINSNQLVVTDFMTSSTTTDTKNEGQTTTASADGLKIPAFLDCTINAEASTLIYDNLQLKNIKGTLLVKDQKAEIKNLSTSLFGGKITFDGFVSTKEKQPNFDMKLDLSALDIAQSFTQFDFLKKVAPIANIIQGNMNAAIQLKGKLDGKEMTPDLNSLTGDLRGQFLDAALKPENSKMLSSLNSQFQFLNPDKLNLKNLKAYLQFADGKVSIQPIALKIDDIPFEISGSHGFDQNMNYKLDLNVPAKYLGAEVTNLLSKLNPNDQAKINSVPVKINLTGTFDSPKIGTDLRQATSAIVQQLVEHQKQNLINKGKDALTGILSNNTPQNKPGDTTATTNPAASKEEIKSKVEDAAKDKIKEGIKNLFGKDKNQ